MGAQPPGEKEQESELVTDASPGPAALTWGGVSAEDRPEDVRSPDSRAPGRGARPARSPSGNRRAAWRGAGSGLGGVASAGGGAVGGQEEGEH